jgi:hypothetical protein
MKRQLFIILSIFFLYAFTNEGQAYAVKGVMDLRLETFQSSIPLEGQWEVYWNQLKSPSDLFESDHYVEFPHLWKGQVIGQDTMVAQGYATYRLKIILPNTPADYELYIDDMYCAYALYVDDELVAKNGIVNVDRSGSEPEWRPQIVQLKEKYGTIELVLNISNWRHSKGGANNPILLGKASVVSSEFDLYVISQIALFMGCLFTSLFFFFRFTFRSYDWASFFFAFFLVSYNYRLIGADTYLLHQWLEGYPWGIAIRFEYFSLYFSTLLFSLFVYHLYRGEVKRWILWPLLVTCIVFSLTIFFTEPIFFTRLLGGFFVIMIIYIGYGFFIFAAAVINGKIGSLYGILSVSVVFASFVYQILYYVGWLEYKFLVTLYAHVLFLVFQSIQLYNVSRYSNTSEDL